MLHVQGVRAGYGDLPVLNGVDISVGEGELVAVLGANGSGKSTLLRAIAGLVRPHQGSVCFEGRSIHGVAADAVARAGLSLVPEGRQIFAALSVWENLQLGAYPRRLAKPVLRAEVARIAQWFPVIAQRSGQLAGLLSGGEQQMLAVARALMARPRMLLLDEPSVGLSPRLKRDLFLLLRQIRAETGTGMLIVEQDPALALDLADHAYVLAQGLVVDEGPSQDIAARWSGRHTSTRTLS